MSLLRFIHAADLHLGSPMQKLSRYPGAPVEKMRGAPQRAVENLFQLALDHQVDALLIAGDLFDGPWQDMHVGLWLVEQMKRLGRAGIPIVCLRGNHDALSRVRSSIDWPENVTEFPDKSTSIELDCGLVIHGRSFQTPKVKEDIAQQYPAASSGAFNIGMLHTSLEGNAQHDVYAPTSIEVLREKGYDYWALGHIHMRSELSLADDFWVGYSGNTQGRSIRETGPKGCVLVEVVDRKVSRTEFLPTDIARWDSIDLDLSDVETLAEVRELAGVAFEQAVDRSEGRCLAVRVNLVGSSSLHEALGNHVHLNDLSAQLRSLATDFSEFWLEKIVVRTESRVSRASQENVHALLGILNRLSQEIVGDSNRKQVFEEMLTTLGKKLGSEQASFAWQAEMKRITDQQLQRWIDMAIQCIQSSAIGDDPLKNLAGPTSS